MATITQEPPAVKPKGLLARVVTGLVPAPHRTLLYGVQGIGKTTWGVGCPRVKGGFGPGSPKRLLLQFEEGANRIDCSKWPEKIKDWSTLEAVLTALIEEDHPYQAVVVDTVDWLEQVIWRAVCAEGGKASIEDFGYGKGYTFALGWWQRFLAGLDLLREKKRMDVVLLGHAQTERLENPETDSWDRYAPKLHKKSAALLVEWCDDVLFAHTKTDPHEVDGGRKIGLRGSRVIYTGDRAFCVAKNRLQLPDELPIEWAAYEEFLKRGQK